MNEIEVIVLAREERDNCVYELCVPRDLALEAHLTDRHTLEGRGGNHILQPFIRLSITETEPV